MRQRREEKRDIAVQRAVTVTAIETIFRTVAGVETVTTIVSNSQGEGAVSATTRRCSNNESFASTSTTFDIVTTTTLLSESSTPSISSPSTSLDITTSTSATETPTSTLSPSPFPTEPASDESPLPIPSQPSQSKPEIPTTASGPMASSTLIPVGAGIIESLKLSSTSTSESSSVPTVFRVTQVLSGGIISQAVTKTEDVAPAAATTGTGVDREAIVTGSESLKPTGTESLSAIYTGGSGRVIGIETRYLRTFAFGVTIFAWAI
ncbi:hypothetical protein ABW19_dt0207005 [Dactylella cylindrospora]|nr:hypothetical protein ABW19_dt0207005 [Dactylella cylindrospora]